MTNTTKVFLNTWQAYNNGCIGYGWMSTDEARAFIDADDERDGGEWFIADVDNYLDVDFGHLECRNVFDVFDEIDSLESMEAWEREEVIAIMEYRVCDVTEAIDSRDDYCIYSDINSFFECCDECISDALDKMGDYACYFDFDAYHRDCMLDAYEASNGVVIL